MTTSPTDNPSAAPTRRRHPLLTALKWAAGIVITLLVLVAVVTGTAVWLLTPPKLTAIINEYAPRYVDADVRVGRAELRFWSTFPRLEVEIDSLEVVSHVFAGLPDSLRQQLPADADSLLSVPRLSGALDLPSLLAMTIELHDVAIERPRVTVARLDSLRVNYMIVAPDTTATETDADSGPLPALSIDRFTIAGDAVLRYVSVADSIDLTVTLADTGLDGTAAPAYGISVAGCGSGHMAGLIRLADHPFGLNGRVLWDPAHPEAVAAEAVDLTYGPVNVRLDAAVTMGDTLRVDALSAELRPVAVAELLDLAHTAVPDLALPAVSTDLTVGLAARLTAPYALTDSAALPALAVSLDIPRGRLDYDRLRLKAFEARINAEMPDGLPDSLRLRIDRLVAIGTGIGFELRATFDARGHIDDPLVSGHFSGGVGFGRLPRQLVDQLPFAIEGTLRGSTDFSLRPSDVMRFNMKAVEIDGEVTLTDFAMAMRDSSLIASTPSSRLTFDSNHTFTTAMGAEVDRVTTVALSIDSAAMQGAGVSLTGSRLRVGVGVRLLSDPTDTTSIRPVGINVSGHRLTLRSDSDSSLVRMRDVELRALLSRFEGAASRPRLDIGADARSLTYADPRNRTMLREAHFDLHLHPRHRPRLGQKLLAVYDSICLARPDLSTDSVYSLTMARARAGRRQAATRPDSLRSRQPSRAEGDIDFGVGSTFSRLLRLWEAGGSLTARSGVAFTPYFPVRNRVSNVNLHFNTDSVTIDSLRYRCGSTSVVVNGAVTDIATAMTSRRGAPIKVRFNLDFDTLDVNTLAAAAFAGSAFAQRADSASVSLASAGSTDGDSAADEAMLETMVVDAVGEETVAFVVPTNIEANLSMRVRRMVYADMWFNRLVGRLQVKDGAIHLDRLGGYTDAGALDLTALYSAPDRHNVDFAAGMVIRRLDLKRFLHMMPQVDSLLPLLDHIEGIITADMAVTTRLDSLMNIEFNTLRAAVSLEGDSLVVLDNDTFRTLSKWLVFKKKDHNMIDHMAVEFTVADNKIDFMPFMFDIDRYRLGVWGGNTLDMRYDYHIAVLKSPLPFKFGIGISGQGDDFRIKLGKARFNPDQIVSQKSVTDTTRVNLVNEIRRMFDYGAQFGNAPSDGRTGNRRRGMPRLTPPPVSRPEPDAEPGDTFTHADSLLLIQEGVIDSIPAPASHHE